MWEQSSTPFMGSNQQDLDSIFRRIVHEEHAIALALSLRTDSMPEEWAALGPLCDASMVNVSCSHRYIQPGLSRFILPASVVPETFESGQWTLVVNGEEWPVLPGIPMDIELSTNTEAVTVGLRLELEDETYEQHLLLPVLGSINCPEPDLPPWPSPNAEDPYWVGIFDDGEPVTGQALVKMGSDGLFDKPLIILEGFDPNVGGHMPMYGYGDLNWEVIWNCDGAYNEALGGLGSMLEAVLQEGFDLVFLDFEDGTRSIYQQAKLLRLVIEQCRDYRANADPLVVIGPSMGGVVAREALRSMEMEGMEHCVRLFAALDSPFRGAYLPIALQEAIAFFAGFSVDADRLFNALLSPAASELLVASPFHSAEIRSNLEGHQQQQGLPNRCVNLAVANGHPNVPNSAPALWYAATESFLGWDYVNIHLHGQPGDLTHPETATNSPVIFEASLLNPTWEWGESLVLDGLAWTDIDLPHFEDLPGGTSTHMAKFKAALSLVGIEPDSYTPTSVYVPTLSALDIPLGQSFAPDEIDFDFWSLEPIETSPAPHCDVSQHFAFLWDHIVHGQPLLLDSSALDTAWCLGWQNPNQQLITGAATPYESEYSIDIGTSSCNGPGEWPIFSCETSPCSPALNIGAGQTLIIGDSLGAGSSHAHFTLTKGSSLNVRGSVHIGPHSTLVLEENAELVLENGALHVAPFGSIIQKTNSRIKTLGGGNIFLNGSQAVWYNEGVVHLNPFDTLLVTSLSANQAGEIKFANVTGYSFLGNHSLFAVKGTPEAAVDLTLTAEAKTATEGQGTLLMEHANVHFHNATEWHVGIKSRLKNIIASGYTPDHKWLFSNRMRWHSGALYDMALTASNGGIAGVILQEVIGVGCTAEFTNTGIRLDGCDFEQSTLQCSNLAPHSQVGSCSFFGGGENLPQLEVSSSTSNLFLEDNRFENHTIGLRLLQSQATASCNAWIGNEIGVFLDTLSFFNAQSPFGKNQWLDNGIHIRCQQANLPLFASGTNTFGAADDALLLGTLNYPIEGDPSMSNPPHVVLQNGNIWPNAILDVPLMVPYLGLESTTDGGSIHFWDQSPTQASCALSTGHQSYSKPGRKVLAASDSTAGNCLLFPNPADETLHISLDQQRELEDVHFEIIDVTGKSVQTFYSVTPTAQGICTIPVHQLEIGWYTIRVYDDGQLALQKAFVINR
ncbi:MAG: T9SS type A sorting domain-containing protein [Flavobacteriales bacterium]